jgi:hypothetical protein
MVLINLQARNSLSHRRGAAESASSNDLRPRAYIQARIGAMTIGITCLLPAQMKARKYPGEHGAFGV